MHIKPIRAALLDQGRTISVHARVPEPTEVGDVSKIDVVVLHVLGDDYGHARDTRQRYPGLPIVMLASDIESATRRICKELDPAVMLVGPISYARLIPALYAAVEGSISP